MASREHAAEARRPVPRLYLVTPQVDRPAGIRDALAAALDVADVAAVLLRLQPVDERAAINHVKALAPVVQDKGVALILDGLPDLVARAGADGAHLTGIAAFNAALPALKPARIAGCGGLTSRHDAMLAAEGGADYVLFGEPDTAGHRPSLQAVVERVAWWAEVFQVQCVGYAATLAEIKPLAEAGADFVAVGECIFADTRGPARAIAEAAQSLSPAEAVP